VAVTRRAGTAMTDPSVWVIGLTGPIGCGKSTVGRILSELGGTVIDADQLARDVTGPGEATLPEIRARFGDAVFASDGSLDRAAMANVVFDDPAALADLEKIVHPAVRRRLEKDLAAAGSDAPFVAVEAIKLVEGGLADRCDEVWLIECSPETQRERVVARGADPGDTDRRLRTQGEDLVARLAAQLDGRMRYRRLSTDGSIADTRERVENALADLLEAGRSSDGALD
jgi:dephospho-CoA kinase